MTTIQEFAKADEVYPLAVLGLGDFGRHGSGEGCQIDLRLLVLLPLARRVGE